MGGRTPAVHRARRTFISRDIARATRDSSLDCLPCLQNPPVPQGDLPMPTPTDLRTRLDALRTRLSQVKRSL